MNYQGDYAEDATVYVIFNTFTSDDPSASSTITNFINTDVHIHKDDGLTQRNNAAGITVSVDFDGITGSHMVKIDTNDDTVGGFWVAGADYFVRIEGTTVDGATINAMVGHFSIENRFNQTVVPDAAGVAPTVAEIQAEMEEDGDSLLDTIKDELANGTDGLSALKALIDTIDGIVDNILTDTGSTLDTLIKDIPTVAEFEARSDVAGTAATPAEVATALTTYDAPTKAEMDTGHGLLATEAKQDVIDGIADNILADTGTDGVVLKAAGLAADAVDEILDEVVEGTLTLRQCIRIFLSALAGKSTGGGTTTVTFRDNADGKARITATVTADGNRTAMTLDGA